MGRYFTLREAESLLPQIQARLEKAIDAKSRISAIDCEMEDLTHRISLMGGLEVDADLVAQRKLERASLVLSVEKSVRSIQRCGCVVKDLDVGLLDFPALLNGVEVFLCWKLGEPRIEWWHSTKEGYAGRRRIVDEFDTGNPGLLPN